MGLWHKHTLVSYGQGSARGSGSWWGGVLQTHRQARYPVFSILSRVPYLPGVTFLALGSFRPRGTNLALMRGKNHAVTVRGCKVDRQCKADYTNPPSVFTNEARNARRALCA